MEKKENKCQDGRLPTIPFTTLNVNKLHNLIKRHNFQTVYKTRFNYMFS